MLSVPRGKPLRLTSPVQSGSPSPAWPRADAANASRQTRTTAAASTCLRGLIRDRGPRGASSGPPPMPRPLVAGPRATPAWVNDGDAVAVLAQPGGDVDPEVREGADGHQQYVGPVALSQYVDLTEATQGRQVLRYGAGREAHDGRTVIDADRLAQLGPQGARVTRCRDAQAWDHAEHGHVPDAVVAGAVRPGNAGAVEHQGDR